MKGEGIYATSARPDPFAQQGRPQAVTVDAHGEIHPRSYKGFCCGGRCQVLKSWDELGVFSWSTETSEPSK